MNRLDRKIVLITGARGGLGNAVTTKCLDEGAAVIGVSRSIRAEDFPHARFTAMPAGLSNVDAARQVADRIVAAHGRIDALIHVVGGFEGGPGIADTDDAVIDRMLDLNYRSAFHIARAVLPHMRKQGSGRIVAVASRQAVAPAAGVGAYSASKAALVSLMGTIAIENQDRGITANSVLPGTMDTPANRAAMPGADGSHWVQPASVAELLVFLASDAASQITGAAIPVYGLA